MLRFFRRGKPKKPDAVGRRARLLLEMLEARDCPSAPSLTFTATPAGQRLVELSGHVTDENPSGVTINFNGAVVGSTLAGASGDFNVTMEAGYLGTIYGYAVDQENLSSNLAQDTLTSEVPSVTLALSYGAQGMVTLSGQVTDDCPSGLEVQFGGSSSLAGVTAVVNSDGSFQSTVQLQPGEEGIATAQTSDWWNQSSDQAQAALNSAPFLTLSYSRDSQGTVTLSGQVTHESPGGLTVTFSGVATGSTVTNADGTFSFQTEVSGMGTIQATTVDSEGRTSNTAEVTVGDNPPTISSFTAVKVGANTWTFQGTVTDENPEGLVVRLGGLPSLSGATAVVSCDGSFQLTAELQTWEGGTATAQTTDEWGQDSNQAQATVNNTPALILTMTQGAGRTVLLSGRVFDENPGALTVTFNGVATGSVITNADGTFSFQTTATGLGTIQATTQDAQGLASNTAEVTVTSNPPEIVDFTAIEEGTNLWTFKGKVNAPYTEGMIVRLGGIPSLIGKTATVEADGWFYLTVLTAGEQGWASAQTTNEWWQDSNQALTLVITT